MSLASLLTKLTTVRGAIIAALGSKGVSLASSATLHDCASAIRNIAVSSVTVSSGAEVTLGYINSSGQFQPLEFSGTTASDGGTAVTLSCYTWNLPGAAPSGGGTSSNIIVDYGTLNVSSGWKYLHTQIKSGATMSILNGGIANDTLVSSGGLMNIYSGGKADIISGSSVGKIEIFPGASVTRLNTEDGCEITISAAPGTDVSGSNYQGRGDRASFTMSNGIMSTYNVNNKGLVQIQSGCSTWDTIISSGGSMVVGISGGAEKTRISAGGYMLASSGATVTSITVSSGGTFVIVSGAVVNNLTSMTGAVINS